MVISEIRVVLIRKVFDEIMGIGNFCSVFHVFLAAVKTLISVDDVIVY
jgi:hypothetical protein